MADAFTFDLFRAMEEVNKIVPALLRGYGLNVKDNVEDIKQTVITDLFARQEYLKTMITNQSYLNAVIKHSAILAMKPLLKERAHGIDLMYPMDWLRANIDQLIDGYPSVPTIAYMPQTLRKATNPVQMIVINHSDEDTITELTDFRNAFECLTEKQQIALTRVRTTPTHRSAYHKALDRLLILINKPTNDLRIIKTRRNYNASSKRT